MPKDNEDISPKFKLRLPNQKLAKKENKFLEIIHKNIYKINLQNQQRHDEKDQDYIKQIEKIQFIPDKIPVIELLENKFLFSPNHCENDSSCIAFFKSAMRKDQDLFLKYLNSNTLGIDFKKLILGFSMIIACSCRDLDVIKFLVINAPESLYLTIISDLGYVEEVSALIFVKQSSFCNPDYFDKEIINFFLHYLDINKKREGSTEYFKFFEYIPEEVAIKLLSKVHDLSEKQLSLVRYQDQTLQVFSMSYHQSCIMSNKYSLAEAIINRVYPDTLHQNDSYSLILLTLQYMRNQVDVNYGLLDFMKFIFSKGKLLYKVNSEPYASKIFQDYELAKIFINADLLGKEAIAQHNNEYRDFKFRMESEELPNLGIIEQNNDYTEILSDMYRDQEESIF